MPLKGGVPGLAGISEREVRTAGRLVGDVGVDGEVRVWDSQPGGVADRLRAEWEALDGESMLLGLRELAGVISTAEASLAIGLAVAEAKVASTEASLLAGSKLIELAGARATQQQFGLDRFWRNARTHTVHDPVRWKYRAIGDYWLNGINPPRHGAI